jgi:hypothetical protein
MDDALEQFRLPVEHKPAHSKKPPKCRRQSGWFVRGPIPLAWLDPVLSMHSRTPLALAVALWFQSGLERSNTVRLTHKLRQRFRLPARSIPRALKDMETAGLVRVVRQPGRCHMVEILEQPPP